MSLIIREDDVNIDTLRERVKPQDGEAACCSVVDAITRLKGLRTHRGEGEGTHEVLRALLVAHAALTDAFIL